MNSTTAQRNQLWTELSRRFRPHVDWSECPEYEGLGPDARADFARLVDAQLLFEYVEDCKIELIASGVTVPDLWLHPLCAARIRPGVPLPDSEEAQLGKILSQFR